MVDDISTCTRISSPPVHQVKTVFSTAFSTKARSTQAPKIAAAVGSGVSPTTVGRVEGSSAALSAEVTRSAAQAPGEQDPRPPRKPQELPERCRDSRDHLIHVAVSLSRATQWAAPQR